jgi:hypothetical protein
MYIKKNRSAVKRVVEDTFSDWIDRGIVTNVLWFGGSSGSKHRPAQPAMVILYISPNNIELANSATTNVVRSAIVVPAVKEDEPKVKLKKLQEMFQEKLRDSRFNVKSTFVKGNLRLIKRNFVIF